MTALSASFHWPLALERMVPDLLRRLGQVHPDLQAADLWGDEEEGVLHAELAEAGDRATSTWIIASVLAASVWVPDDGWLPDLGVGLRTDVGGFRTDTCCSDMVLLAGGHLTRSQWLSGAALGIGPRA